MSREVVGEVIRRALEDGAFRARLAARPRDVLHEYDVTPEEQGALVAATVPQLVDLGVDEATASRYEEAIRAEGRAPG